MRRERTQRIKTTIIYWITDGNRDQEADRRIDEWTKYKKTWNN